MIRGHFYLAEQSTAILAEARELDTGSISVVAGDSAAQLAYSARGEHQFGSALPGLAVEVTFADGSRFVPADSQFRWQGLSGSKQAGQWLESNWPVALLSILLIPAFIWYSITVLIPSATVAMVPKLPWAVSEQLGQQTIKILDASLMSPSQLPEQQQLEVRQQWQQVLSRLELPKQRYQLLFRATPLGANAFALADGTVVITDAAVQLLSPKPHAITAVLLHEIGHVEHQHVLKMVAQSTATSLFFGLLLGDLEGASELILGAGLGVLESSFSRDMEREADNYALEKLERLNISPMAFANAMSALTLTAKARAKEQRESHWLDYLSSHPAPEERIKAAIDAAEAMPSHDH